MGPDWSIVDSDEFDLDVDINKEGEGEEEEEEGEEEETEIFRGKKLNKILLPCPLVNGKHFANGDVNSLGLEEDEHVEGADEEETRNEEEDNEEEEEEGEEKEEEEEEEEEEESYREGQVFKSLLMLAR